MRKNSKKKGAGSKPSKKTVHHINSSVSRWQHLKGIIGWSFIIVVVFAALSVAANYFDTNVKDKTQPSVNQKFHKVSTLSLLDDEDDDDISLIVTGDLGLVRYVELLMRKQKDYTYPFQKVADFLNSADITFGNLETPIIPGVNTPKGSYTFRSDPETIQGLLFAGYDVLSLANNHTMNYQAKGLLRTLDELANAGIATSGAGKNQDEAHTPAVLEVKGKKIAFYSYIDQSIPPGPWLHGEAKYNKPGIARMDLEAVKNDVKNALAYSDMVIVSMHAGKEYTREPTKFQKDFAHAAIDAGATVVIGHHPHVVQPVEYYNNGVIFYSLGNFIFDQFFSEDVQTGLVAKILLKADEKPKVELYPVKIDKTQPRILDGQEREEMTKKLGL